jgi:hypothetical protein
MFSILCEKQRYFDKVRAAQVAIVSSILLITLSACRVGGNLTTEAESRITASPTPEAISDNETASVAADSSADATSEASNIPAVAPANSDVISGAQYLDSTGAWQTGALTDLGAIVISSVSQTQSSGRVSSISVNANAVVNSAMGAHTDFPTDLQVLSGKYFLTNTATPILGTMTDHGAVSVTSTSTSYGAGYVSSISVNGNSVINSALGGHTAAAVGDVYTGKYFLTTTSTPAQGSMTNLGAISVTSAATTTGAGYVSGITVSAGADFLNTNICSGKTILGVNGSASCIGAAGTGTEATASYVCSNKYLWDRNGTAVNGTRYCAPDLSYTTGLTLWLKADDLNANGDLNSGYTDGGAVTTWKDSSGSGRDVTQSTSGRRPTYNLTRPGHFAVVRFDGVDDNLYRTNTGSDLFSNVNQVDIFAVMMQRGSQVNNMLLSLALPDANNVVNIYATYGNVLYIDYGNSTVTGGGRWAANQPTTWDEAFHVLEIYRSGTTAEISVDGTTLTPFTGGGASTNPSDSLDNTLTGTFVIGADSSSAALLKGDVAEILIFESALGAPDRTTVRCYLANKYGLGITGC